jgi:hypothetical protein
MNLYLGLGEDKNPVFTTVQTPPGFTPPDFDCPKGSDFAMSQEVGMCVAADASPVYSQVVPGGPRTFYNLDGSVAGMDSGGGGAGAASKFDLKKMFSGIPNYMIYVGGGLLALIVFQSVSHRRGRY